MSSLEELKKKFIVNEDMLKRQLQPLVEKALKYCVVDEKGNVHFNDTGLSPREKFRLMLAARALAAQLDDKISAEVSVEEVSHTTGLPADQVRARANELVKKKLAQSAKSGSYSALPFKVEALLNSVDARRPDKKI